MSYTAKSIAFVFHLKDKKHASQMQSVMVEFLNLIESDDLIYMKHEGGRPFTKPMKIVPLVADYRFEADLSGLIRDALDAFEDDDRDKTIYVLTDWLENYYQINKIIDICHKNEVRLVFFETGAFFVDLATKLPYFGNSSVEEFSKFIVEDYTANGND